MAAMKKSFFKTLRGLGTSLVDADNLVNGTPNIGSAIALIFPNANLEIVSPTITGAIEPYWFYGLFYGT
jgi:hypothetical protein